MIFSKDYQKNVDAFKNALHLSDSFDLICKDTLISDKKACIFFVDGLTKDETM